MKKRIFLGLIAILFLLYSGIWYYLACIFEDVVNNSEKFYSNGQHTIKYEKFKKSGFPFKIGLNCEGLVETQNNVELGSPKAMGNITTTYSSPVYIGYDLLSRKFHVNYNGEGFSQTDNKEYGDDITIDASISAGYGFFDFVQFALGKTENFLDKISYITVKIDNILVKDTKTKKQFVNIENFITSINSIKSDKEGFLKIAIASQGSLHKNETESGLFFNKFFKSLNIPEYKYNFEGTISIPEQNKGVDNNLSLASLSGIEIDISELKDSGPFFEGKTKLQLNIPKEIFSNELFSFKYDVILNLEPGFLNSFSSYSNGNDSVQQYVDRLKSIISKYQDPKRSELNIDFIGSMNPINFKINSFKFMIDDSGFNIAGKLTDKNSEYDINFAVNLFEYTRILDFIVNEWLPLFSDDLDYISNYHEIYYKALVKTLKFVSESPDSDSKDIELDITCKGNLTNSMIGKYLFADFWQIFYQNIYNEVLPTLSDTQNIREEILKIIPDLKDKPDLLDNLMKNSGN